MLQRMAVRKATTVSNTGTPANGHTRAAATENTTQIQTNAPMNVINNGTNNKRKVMRAII